MSQEINACFLTLGILLIMVVWVPFLELLQQVVRGSRQRSIADSSRVQVVDADHRGGGKSKSRFTSEAYGRTHLGQEHFGVRQ